MADNTLGSMTFNYTPTVPPDDSSATVALTETINNVLGTATDLAREDKVEKFGELIDNTIDAELEASAQPISIETPVFPDEQSQNYYNEYKRYASAATAGMANKAQLANLKIAGQRALANAIRGTSDPKTRQMLSQEYNATFSTNPAVVQLSAEVNRQQGSAQAQEATLFFEDVKERTTIDLRVESDPEIITEALRAYHNRKEIDLRKTENETAQFIREMEGKRDARQDAISNKTAIDLIKMGLAQNEELYFAKADQFRQYIESFNDTGDPRFLQASRNFDVHKAKRLREIDRAVVEIIQQKALLEDSGYSTPELQGAISYATTSIEALRQEKTAIANDNFDLQKEIKSANELSAFTYAFGMGPEYRKNAWLMEEIANWPETAQRNYGDTTLSTLGQAQGSIINHSLALNALFIQGLPVNPNPYAIEYYDIMNVNPELYNILHARKAINQTPPNKWLALGGAGTDPVQQAKGAMNHLPKQLEFLDHLLARRETAYLHANVGAVSLHLLHLERLGKFEGVTDDSNVLLRQLGSERLMAFAQELSNHPTNPKYAEEQTKSIQLLGDVMNEASQAQQMDFQKRRATIAGTLNAFHNWGGHQNKIDDTITLADIISIVPDFETGAVNFTINENVVNDMYLSDKTITLGVRTAAKNRTRGYAQPVENEIKRIRKIAESYANALTYMTRYDAIAQAFLSGGRYAPDLREAWGMSTANRSIYPVEPIGSN
tara:strand:+ start:9183 stop:11351 length:2169 start_codon:yes stop_codon:yes gene_type:complete